MRPIPRYKQVFVSFGQTVVAGAQIQFPLVKELRDKRIIAIEFYPVTILSRTLDQVAAIAAADALGCEVVLKENSVERIDGIPLTTMNPVAVGGIYKQFVGFVVNWEASFIRVNATPVTLPCSVPFGFIYEQ